MAISLSTAKRLCTEAELELFAQSMAKKVSALDKKALKSSVVRSRRMRDKYSRLADRQDREARGKQKPRRANPSQGSEATRKKVRLFAESLARYEKQLNKLESTESKKAAPAKKPVAEKCEKAKKVTVKKAVAKKAAAKKAAVKKAVKRAVARKVAEKSKPAIEPVSSILDKSKRPKIAPPQRLAATKAKSARAKVSGKARHARHLSAETRRRQARRDSR